MASPSLVSFTKHKANVELIDPRSKPKPKKVKASLSATSHKHGGNATLALLHQVNAMLEAMLLADNPNLVLHASLKKHQEAVELMAQQQLFSLDITL
ncbi:hypothetical protein C0989_002737 [Termitomyces sp. Mn162]|nr:hypothetical protein C0989_002737 [Termitomyces sp. Mn162]